MKYNKTITLKNGKGAILRNGISADGEAVYENFNKSHGETDFLLSYPDENSFDPQQESAFLAEKTKSTNEVQIIALIDGNVAGMAGIEAVGSKYKVKHRAELGISILKEYWGLGLGRALMEACIECAKDAGYTQLELNVVADNDRAISLYKSCGFVEFARNPRGFNSRYLGYQELIYMRLELSDEDEISYEQQERIKRITAMEEIYDKALSMLKENPAAIPEYRNEIRKLTEYYESPQWKSDYELDESGMFPKDLKRGVLSEDGVYNLLESIKQRDV